MTIDLHGSVGASSTQSLDWKSLPWDQIRQEVRRLQMRIAKAIKEKTLPQSQGFAVDSHALEFGQIPGRPTSDDQQGTPHTWDG